MISLKLEPIKLSIEYILIANCSGVSWVIEANESLRCVYELMEGAGREEENLPLEKFMNVIKLFTTVQIRYNNLFYEKILI